MTADAAVAPRAPRTVHVERCTGTVFTLDNRDHGTWDAAITDAAHPDVRTVLELCAQVQADTAGYFTAILGRTTVTGREFAVATSGNTERGAHLTDPFTGRAISGWGSATAAVVMGERAAAWAQAVPGYQTLHVADGGVRRMSAGW